MMAMLDAHREVLQKGSPKWVTVTRSDTVRVLLAAALEQAK
jgi:hypothetical protein